MCTGTAELSCIQAVALAFVDAGIQASQAHAVRYREPELPPVPWAEPYTAAPAHLWLELHCAAGRLC